MDLEKLECCGVLELSYIEDETSHDAVYEVADRRFDGDYDYDSAFIIFTSINDETYGQELREYITKHELGTVTKQRAKENPNTNNMIHLYIWAVNNEKLEAWYNKQ